MRVAVSMAATGRPHENALAERVDGILKQEYGLGKVIENEGKARRLATGVPVDRAIAFYNGKCPHVSTPDYRQRVQIPEQMHSEVYWDAGYRKQDLAQGFSSLSGIKKVSVKTEPH